MRNMKFYIQTPQISDICCPQALPKIGFELVDITKTVVTVYSRVTYKKKFQYKYEIYWTISS